MVAFRTVCLMSGFSPVIDLVANTVYSILVRFRLCKRAPRNYAYDPENQTGFLSMSPLPGSARAEAERRRYVIFGWSTIDDT